MASDSTSSKFTKGVRRRSVAAAVATCAVVVVGLVGLVGCGGGGPSVAQLRETVHRYLDATTPAERCQLLTTVYRTENPEVLLSGGCRQSERITPAEEAARRGLRVAHVNVSGNQATVSLTPLTSRPSIAGDPAAPRLTGLELETEAGRWRVNGFTESASGTASAG